MASIFRKPGKKTWWVTYYLDGTRIRYSLRTKDERIARKKLKRLDADLITGDLEPKTHTPIRPFLEAFCTHFATIRSAKAYKNDTSYLRTFFGPVCKALEPKNTVNRRFKSSRRITVLDRLSHRHVAVGTLEQLTAREIEGWTRTSSSGS